MGSEQHGYRLRASRPVHLVPGRLDAGGEHGADGHPGDAEGPQGLVHLFEARHREHGGDQFQSGAREGSPPGRPLATGPVTGAAAGAATPVTPTATSPSSLG